MAHHRFAQRAWLTQEKGVWASRTCLLDTEDSESVVGVQAPALAGGWGRAGLRRGLAGNISHPELGCGYNQSQGAVKGSGEEKEVEGRH